MRSWWYTSSTFDNYSSDVWLSSASSKIEDAALKTKLGNASFYLNTLKYDLDILLNICVQANWHENMVIAGHLDKFDNRRYGTVIVDAFLTRYRSACDTIAKTIGKVSEFPDQAPDSFTDLRNKMKIDNNLRLLGEDLTRLIQDCDWYYETVEIRDEIVHRNAQTSAFAADTILFQVMKDFTNMIKIPEVSFNENLVDFELFAGVHVAYTLWFLEEFADIAYTKLPPKKCDSQPHKFHDGYGVLKEWIERVLNPQAK